MRKILLAAWLLIPVGAWAYHLGPGQDRLELDEVSRLIGKAEQCVAEGDHETAVILYNDAITQLPEGQDDRARKLRLERAKSQMLAKQLPEARSDLQELLSAVADDDSVPEDFKDEVRSALANSQYYMTWLMRLEGRSRDEWQPEIEASRQSFRLLAEKAKSKGQGKAAEKHQKDLESSIRLARLELKDLQGLPLPSQ